MIVIGPGSLFTSLLPALLVPGIREAIAASGALVVFACNVATQPGETGGFDLADHLDALARHGAGAPAGRRPGEQPVRRAGPAGLAGRARPAALAARRPPTLRASSSTISSTRPMRTTTIPARLAAAILAAWEREGGHRRRPSVARVGRTA